MIGAIIGDICGSVYEWDNCRDYDKVELFRQDTDFTDDTVLSLAVAQAILDFSPRINYDFSSSKVTMIISEISRELGIFAEDYPGRGYGGMFNAWVRTSPKKRLPYNSFGNGSAMRVSSAGWVCNSLSDTLRLARCTAVPTHNHPEGIKGAEAVAGAIYLARTGRTKKEIAGFITDLGYDLNFTIDGIRDTYEFSETCQESVPQAIKCFLESTGFEQSIRLAISLGGDSDTIAAMTGAVSEAFYGVPLWMEHEARIRLPLELRDVYAEFLNIFKIGKAHHIFKLPM